MQLFLASDHRHSFTVMVSDAHHAAVSTPTTVVLSHPPHNLLLSPTKEPILNCRSRHCFTALVSGQSQTTLSAVIDSPLSNH